MFEVQAVKCEKLVKLYDVMIAESVIANQLAKKVTKFFL